MLLPKADTGNAQPSSGPSSSPRASSSIARSPPAPSYLSARSADVILSEVRPTRIKTEALRSVNVLLDELLWLILGFARSFSPDRLRTGLLKVLPTVLGQNALLEAEVELRAYIERNPPTSPLPTDEATIQKFPLQQAFELLRIKCEAYSSLGDQEENIESETALHARMIQVSGDATPQLSAVAPASLYLTAILEHVCEHVLSNVGRVVARDSSRTTAHSQDLYVALCEDESIYSLFKTMKVQEQIEQQSKPLRPRRSRSLNRNDFVADAMAPGTSTDTPALPNQRKSYDSAISNGSHTNLPNRVSVEKGRSKAIFKTSSRVVGDNGNTHTEGARHHRTNSLLGDTKTSVILPVDAADTNMEVSPDDDGSMQDFDDLMRSGTTMKVSLTPDRLKTFEVFAKEKNQRANRPGGLPSIKDTSSPPSSFPNGHKTSQPSRSRSLVESIAEAPEGDPVRIRAASITHPTPPKVDRPITTSRSRSFTDARAPSSALSSRRTDSSDTISTFMQTIPVNPSTGTPKQTRRLPARNLESIDLDDLMDESDDDIAVPRKVPLTPKSAQMTTSGTRDLMDFLSEGPPEPPSIVPPPSSNTASESRGTKQGRFRTIVSRLTGGASSEKLSPRSDDAYSDTFQRALINGYPTPSRGPLLSKRSVPNVAAAARPMPPPIASPSLDSTPPASGSRTRQLSLSRKAVPTWEALQEKADPPVPPKSVPTQKDSTGVAKPLPQPTSTSTRLDSNPEPVSPTKRRAPREVDLPAKGMVVDEMKPSSPVKPSPPVTSLPSKSPTNGHADVDQESVIVNTCGPSKPDRRDIPPGLSLCIPAGDHVHDFRRLMARATSPDECRVLVDMFLTKCGVLPTDEEHPPVPITPPMSPVAIEVDSHEARLIEVLLGDDGTAALHSTPTNQFRPRSSEPIEEHSSELQPSPTLTTSRSAVAANTA